jgi:hypothetical protein
MSLTRKKVLQYPCMIEAKGAHFGDPLIEEGDALAQQL